MKKWEMPQVKVEHMAANEYVSACKKIEPVNIRSGYYYYLDYDKDGIFDGNDKEDATHPEYGGTGLTDHLALASNQKAKGWLNDVNLYERMKRNGGYNGSQPYQPNDLLGKYDLYILGNNVYLFKDDTYDGTNPPFSPSTAKNYS